MQQSTQKAEFGKGQGADTLGLRIILDWFFGLWAPGLLAVSV